MVENIQRTEVIYFRNVSDIMQHVWGVLQAKYPDDESAWALPFDDNGGDPDGELWLISVGEFVEAFWPHGEEAFDLAVEAGAEVRRGWKFEYTEPTEVPVKFCGFSSSGVGYSLEYPLCAEG